MVITRVRESRARGRSVEAAVVFLMAFLIAAVAISSPPFAARAVAAENPILSVTKNALYGGAAGLLLGGALTLVVDRDSRDDVLRWGVVIGTFGGFGYGIYDLHRKAKEESGFSGPLRPSPGEGATLAARTATAPPELGRPGGWGKTSERARCFRAAPGRNAWLPAPALVRSDHASGRFAW